jgi:hypothetical protein
MTPLYIYPDKLKVRAIFVFGLILIPAAYYLWKYEIYTFSVVLWIAAFFNTIINFPKAFLNKPMLVLDENGIKDHMNMPSVGFIPWSAIKRAEYTEIMGFKNILVILKDPESFIKSKSFFLRPFMKSNQNNLDSCVFFRTNVLPENPDKILDLINQMVALNEKP